MKTNKHSFNYFLWIGSDQAGKRVTNKLYANTREEVIDILQQKNINVRLVKAISPPVFTAKKHRANAKEITAITKQLATMLNASLPLSTSLSLIANNLEKTECRLIMLATKRDVEAGISLSSALKSASDLFDDIYINLVLSAEQSGLLGPTFERISEYREKSEQQKSKLMKALLYPVVVIALALVTTYLMLTIVIPEFEDMFNSFNAELPWFTQQVLLLSHWLTDNWLSQGALIISLIILFKFALKLSLQFRFFIDRLILNIPLIGNALSKSIISRFSRSLAISVRSGVPIVSGLHQCSHLAGNLFYQKHLSNLHNETATGIPIYVAMKRTHCFPPLMVQLIMVGEQSGMLDQMLDKVANIYETELDDTLDRMGILIEPLLIVILGLIVGSLVVAIYLPIFNMMDILG